MILFADTKKLFIFSAFLLASLCFTSLAESDEETDRIIKVPLRIENPCKGHRFEKDGVFRQYYPDGTLFVEGVCVEDRKEGVWKQFYPNGKLWIKENFHKGLLDGKVQKYKSGILDKEKFYSQGEVIPSLNNMNDTKIIADEEKYDFDVEIYPFGIIDSSKGELQKLKRAEKQEEKSLRYNPYLNKDFEN